MAKIFQPNNVNGIMKRLIGDFQYLYSYLRGSGKLPWVSIPDNSATRKTASVFLDSYPDSLSCYKKGCLIFKNGSRQIVCDKNGTDLMDMCSTEYPIDAIEEPDLFIDPGRIRCEAFFRKMYGRTQEEVINHLTMVDWFGYKIEFSEINDAAEHLKDVEKELKQIPSVCEMMVERPFTFEWRVISGCNQLSLHSFGIAIDICVSQSDYWRWSNPSTKENDIIHYRNRIPYEIVRIFEKNGFIWGGKWYHFDTMHFEYRPELLKSLNNMQSGV